MLVSSSGFSLLFFPESRLSAEDRQRQQLQEVQQEKSDFYQKTNRDELSL